MAKCSIKARSATWRTIFQLKSNISPTIQLGDVVYKSNISPIMQLWDIGFWSNINLINLTNQTNQYGLRCIIAHHRTALRYFFLIFISRVMAFYTISMQRPWTELFVLSGRKINKFPHISFLFYIQNTQTIALLSNWKGKDSYH